MIYLPGERNIIIDSKVSLKSYKAYIDSDDETKKDEALKNHITSLKDHIKNLNSKYSDVFQMFEMPSELILKNETLKVYSPSQLFNAIQNLGKKGLSMQRYKGLGEMNPDQLWETTLDPKNRSLIQVKIDDEESTKGVFEDLMGENVLPRKEFIENRADKVVNLDI